MNSDNYKNEIDNYNKIIDDKKACTQYMIHAFDLAPLSEIMEHSAAIDKHLIKNAVKLCGEINSLLAYDDYFYWTLDKDYHIVPIIY